MYSINSKADACYVVTFLTKEHYEEIANKLKGIGSQKMYLISEESGWRDKHFAANFMKIGGSVL